MLYSNACSVLISVKPGSFILCGIWNQGDLWAAFLLIQRLPVKSISVKQAPLIVMPRYANKTWRNHQREKQKEMRPSNQLPYPVSVIEQLWKVVKWYCFIFHSDKTLIKSHWRVESRHGSVLSTHCEVGYLCFYFPLFYCACKHWTGKSFQFVFVYMWMVARYGNVLFKQTSS